ncbi:NAD(P)-dependent oxidoreductase [Actinoalloteichus hymeniacidonis]|uniref:NADH-flavin reductase n=1 Tax=Actinoalloteichus hymeniacidonis TaxID=340345 RepID=A0AAC9MZR8_9PSEU|nr:NAD(P)H-binding protein [Actinoalloteichus hymeniacidonis]AOS65728.1 putative NADH-flavin reductase [Actinoalloteichus hymeniacidonis]MBB5906182.1 putative NADH-flavin reductase [Actinoalloteichus hymeniacidonis]
MRITLFGTTGSVGGRVLAEALSRGHEVLAVIRDARRRGGLPSQVRTRVGDVRQAADVAAASAGQDVVISATRPVSGREHELTESAEALLAGAAQSGVRLILVGGAAGLIVPGTDGATVVEDPDFPTELRAIALACDDQLAACRADLGGADWAYLSPPALLEPGERTGRYRLGADELLVDAAGDSRISLEDFAVALVDEAERPKHHRTRFTVGY